MDLSTDQQKQIKQQVENEVIYDLEYARPQFQLMDYHYSKYHNVGNKNKKEGSVINDYSMYVAMQTMLANLSGEDSSLKVLPNHIDDVNGAYYWEKRMQYAFRKYYQPMISNKGEFNRCFYGNDETLMLDFDEEKQVPMPLSLNPRAFLYDRYGISGQGTPDGSSFYRHAGYITATTLADLKNWLKERDGKRDTWVRMPDVDQKSNFFTGTFYDTGAMQELVKGFYAKDQNKGMVQSGYQNYVKLESDALMKPDNRNLPIYIMHWFTFINNEVHHIIYAGNVQNLVYVRKLEYDRLPIITTPLYPVANARNFISIPLLTLDGQEALKVMKNVSLVSIVREQLSLWVYNEVDIDRPEELTSGDDIFIGTKGEPQKSVERIPRGNPNKTNVDYISSVLDNDLLRTTGITEQQRGSFNQAQQTATEIQQREFRSDKRYLKIIELRINSNSDLLHQAIKVQVNEASTKENYDLAIRSGGAKRNEFINITSRQLKKLIKDPDIIFSNEAIEEAKLNKKIPRIDRIMSAGRGNPFVDQRNLQKWYYEELLQDDDILDELVRPTADQLIARTENLYLSTGTSISPDFYDNHAQHKSEHAKAEQTPEMIAHQRSHDFLEIQISRNPELQQRWNQVNNPELLQQQQGEQSLQDQGQFNPTPNGATDRVGSPIDGTAFGSGASI